MQVVLVMFRSDGERRSFSVVRNMTVIGRREDCDLRIPVGDVSRKHCRLVRTDDGIRIEDLGSSNGTFVNGDRVQESDLHPGDTVSIGPVQFIVQIDGVPDEQEMMPPPAPAAMANDDEDSLIGHQMSPPAKMSSPPPVMPEPPAEEFRIDDESAPVASLGEDVTIDEPPVEDEIMLESPALEETPAETELPLEELPVEQPLAADNPLPEPTAGAVAEDPLALEESPVDELGNEEFPLEELAPEPAAEEEIPLEELPESELGDEEFPLEIEDHDNTLIAAAPHKPAAMEAPAAEPPLELEPLDELDELTPEPPEIELVTEPSASTLEELPAIPPAREQVENVNLDGEELISTDDALDTDTAGESEWDFVVEETDGHRNADDFKIDLDSPHGQPHGQA